MHGKLIVVLDLDEHSGRFRGIERYLSIRTHPRPTSAYIGYAGNRRIVRGGRGFLRAVVTVRGVSAHSGSSRRAGINAVLRAARLVDLLERAGAAAARSRLPRQFPLPPPVTVTALHGGLGYALVPDSCHLNVDMRLTPAFGSDRARTLLLRAAAAIVLSDLLARIALMSLLVCALALLAKAGDSVARGNWRTRR
jgi:succinyl-diaminopimelate desuccinylase